MLKLAALLLIAGPALPIQEEPDRLTGVWAGDIQVPGQPLETLFHVRPDGEGGWTGTADTPVQGVFGLPLVEVRLEEGRRVHFVMSHARYEGVLHETKARLDGAWIQNDARVDFDCEREALPERLSEERLEKLLGTWEGLLKVGAVELRILFQLDRVGPRRLGGHMKSPDQSPLEFDVTRVDDLGEGRVRLCLGTLASRFEAAISPSSGLLEGTYYQGGVRLPLSVRRVPVETELNRPQTPQPPFPYVIEEVRYLNEDHGVTLAGTLTRPEGDGPFPAVLLISGSGAQDRDETIFEHKPFWVLADHLTRRGIAVLRVDDRGVGGSSAGEDTGQETSADIALDVAAGVRFLAAREEVDAARIGLVGHSEGGVIAPLVARDHGGVAFLVLLAGPGLRGDRLLTLQVEAIARAEGVVGEELEAQLSLQREVFEVLLDEALDEGQRLARWRALLEEEAGRQDLELTLAQLTSPWLRWFACHDPAPVLAEIRVPVLALNGRLDLQVPWQPNLEAIAAALEKAGNEDFTTRDLPGLNHLFQHTETGLVSEYGKLEETFAPEVLELIADWVVERAL